MKSELLHDLWSSPDNSRLVSKQFSFRLPVHIAAKITALGEMYPQKNRTQIVADLLSTALDDLEKSLPYNLLKASEDEQRDNDEFSYHHGYEIEPIYELGGTRDRFRKLTNKYYVEFEKELGNDSPIKLFEPLVGSKEFIEGSLK
jgi:hypothetical protein